MPWRTGTARYAGARVSYIITSKGSSFTVTDDAGIKGGGYPS